MVPPGNTPSINLAETRTLTSRIMRWGFGAVVAVMLFITALSFWRVEVANRTLDEIVAHEQAAVEMLYRMQFAARDRTFALFAAVHADDPFVRDAELQRFYAQGAAFGEARNALLKLHLTDRERELLERQHHQTAATLPQHDRVIALLEEGQRAEATAWLVNHAVPLQNKMIGTLTELLDDAIVRTREHAQSGQREQNRTTTLFVLGGLAGLFLIWAIFTQVARRMSGLISHLAHTTERLDASNLDLRFQKMALDEHNIVSIADADGVITAVNDKFCEVSQYSRAELIGRTHGLLKSGQHAGAVYADLWKTIRSGQVWHGELCNRRKDGSHYWVATTILPFVGEDGRPVRYVSVRTDITSLKAAQHALERSRDELEARVAERTHELAEREEILHSITDAAQDAVVMIDPAGRVTYWNPAAERTFGYAEGEILGADLHDLILPDRYAEQQRAGFAHFLQTGEGPVIGRTTTLHARHRDGHEFPVDISLSSVKLRGEWNAVGIVRDATERVQTEHRLQQLATTDTLTGVCNRRRFDEVLEAEIRRAARFGTPFTLALFDIDHFKRVNDTHGHQVGDVVLIELADRVGEAIRATDLFARWGGEEFVVLMPGSDLAAGRTLAEKLRGLVEARRFDTVGRVTCSFGVAAYRAGDTADTLMGRADAGLYQAKAGGRNRVEAEAPAPAAVE